ncbi:MAG: hypothetical protein WCV50_06330 [Patescibacteria group bacterium]|jgi:hypothetical protein
MKKIAFFLGLTILCSALLAGTFLIPHTALAESPSLPNPLGNNANGQPMNLVDVMLRVLQIALAAVDIFALFMFILGGFEFLVSAGNPTMIKKAKDTLIWATLGILVITMSYTILKFLFEVIQDKLS